MSEFGDNSYSYVEHQRMLRETYGMCAEDKAAYFDGVLAGMMGFPADHLKGAALTGYQAGISGKKKSEELRRRKSEAGKRSAESRAEKVGSTDPRANREQDREHCSQSVHDSCEQNVNVGRKEGRKEEKRAVALSQQASLSAPSVNPARERNFSPEAQGQIDLEGLSHTKQPTKAQFVAYAAKRWPRWRSDAVSQIYATWNDARWMDGSGGRIADWVAMLAIYRKRADLSQIGPRYPMGQFAAEHLPELAERMRA